MLWLLACPHPTPPIPTDPAGLLAYASTPATEAAETWYSPLNLTINTPQSHGPASGTLVLGFPDRFYLEIRPPIGGPALVAACDGTAFSVWIPGKQQFFYEPDANAGLSALTGGVAGAGAMVSLLSGRLPALGTPLSLTESLGMVEASWSGPGGTSLKATVSQESGRLTRLIGLNAGGGLAVDLQLMAGQSWPTGLVLTIPALQSTIEATFEGWKAQEVPLERFQLKAPSGVEAQRFQLPQ